MFEPLIKSVLKETIKELPEDFAMKSQSVVPTFLKKGVKQEELEYANLAIPEGKVTKKDLVDAEAKRQDKFTVSSNTRYDLVTIDKKGVNNPTYRTKVLQYGDASQPDNTGYTSAHFTEPNYLAHTRVYDDTLDGTPTRILTEIQSDLHQQGRQVGYGGTNLDLGELRTLSSLVADGSDDEAVDLATRMGWVEDDGDIGAWAFDKTETATANVPKSPYEKTWLRKGIERELVDAVNEGHSQLAIPISGEVKDLVRSEGVQKWYETQVLDTAKKVAKQTNSEFKIVKERVSANADFSVPPFEVLAAQHTSRDLATLAKELSGTLPDDLVDEAETIAEAIIKNKPAWYQESVGAYGYEIDNKVVEYAVIKPKGPFSTTLYSTPVAGAFVAYQALQAGMTEDEVVSKLQKEYKYDEEDIDDIKRRLAVIDKATKAGLDEQTIRAKMEEREKLPEQIESIPPKYEFDPKSDFAARPKGQAYTQLVGENEMTAEQLVSSLKVLHPTLVSDLRTSLPALVGDTEALQRYNLARESSRNRIVKIAKDSYGLDLVWQPDEVGFETWYAQTENGLVKVEPSVWEDLKKQTGEISGGMAGAIAGAKAGAALPLPGAWKGVTGIVGGALGGWLGASAGSQFDYLYQAINMQEDIDAEAMAYKALNATELAAVGEAVGYPVVKSIGMAWKGVIKAKDHIMYGESKAAYQSLKDTLFLDDSQIEAIVTQLEKHATLEGNKYQKAIHAVTLTEPGMQDLVRAAGASVPTASSATAKVVIDRAEQVLAATADLTDEQVPRMFAQDLANYTRDVKDQYRAVKERATKSPFSNRIKFNFDAIAVMPVLERLAPKITDPAVKERFLNQMTHIGSMSESRNFSDLLELRQITNDFLYNKRIIKADDKDTIRAVIKNIDSVIEGTAKYVVNEPETWLDDWAKARTSYSKMKGVERTAMYRAVFDKDGKMRPVEPKTVVKALGKYITAIDGSFEDVMSHLPKKGREMYEGAVIDALATRFAAGEEIGARAIHFPMLADELNKINFTTPNARATKAALLELSETFRNDVWLAKTSGQITIPKFQSYLTTDPVVRAKYEVASGVFNWIKSKAPGDANRQLALVRATAKVLAEPLNAKAFKEVQSEVFDNANLSKQLLDLQQQAARDYKSVADKDSLKIKIDSAGKFTKSSGTTIAKHRIVTLQQAKEIADQNSLTLDSKALDSVLKQYGYEAVLVGTDRVRMLGAK
jgi:hypothetical protein